MKDERDHEQDYGGIDTLPTKEKAQFLVAFAGVILALLAFALKIYFF